MKYRFQFETTDLQNVAIRAAIIFAVSISLAGCGQRTNTGSAASPSNPSDKSVILSASQLSAIKIATVAPYLFHNDREAIGSVNFAEDPSIVQAELTLLIADAGYAAAEKELERAKSLYAANGVSERELEQATSDEQTAKAAFDAARNALLVVGKTDAEISRIIVSGKVGSSFPQREGFKWVLANATESDAPSFRVGQSVRVNVDAVPGREFVGRIAEIYSVVDPMLHRISVRAEVSDPKNELRSGMLADVMIQVARPIESLAIPSNGMVREGDGTMTAWVTADRVHFFQKDIEMGRSEDGRVQILKGLQAGQLVVTDGAVLLDNVLLAPAGD